MVIKDLFTLKKFFRKVKIPIFGAGVYAFSRLGPEEFIPNYRILSLYSSKETALIKKDIPVFCLEEKIGTQLRPRNSSTLLCHQKTQEYLSKFKNPIILLYKSSKRIEKIVKKYNFEVAISPHYFGKQLLEDKIKFRKILQKVGAPAVPGRVLSFLNLSFSELKKEFSLPFTLQHPRRGGGKGTFFIKNEDDFKRAKKVIKEKPTKKIIAAKFVNGPSPSITGCITRFGILSTRPQYQICDIPILYSRPVGSGLFCGHDWSAASDFPKKILFQAKDIVEKVGNYFKKIGYKGIFGIDFVLDQKEEKLYVTECNPRLLGSMPTLTMSEIKGGIPPIIAFHLLEYLGISYEIKIKKIQDLLWQKREGSQMLLHNPLGREGVQEGELKAGIYKMVASKLKFLRSGYKFSHLKDKEEFLLTEGLQKKGAKIKPYQRLTRILAKRRVLDKNLKDITPETKNFIKLVLQKLKVT